MRAMTAIYRRANEFIRIRRFEDVFGMFDDNHRRAQTVER